MHASNFFSEKDPTSHQKIRKFRIILSQKDRFIHPFTMLNKVLILAAALVITVDGFLIPGPTKPRTVCRAKPPPTNQFDLEAIEQFEKELNELNQPSPADDVQDDLEEFFVEEADNTLVVTVQKKHNNKRVDAVIAAMAPELSRSQCGQLMTNGSVKLVLENGKLELLNRKAFKVETGMTIQVELPRDETPLEILPQKLPLNILYEDEHMIVLNKAAGMVVHPAAGNWDGTVVNALAYYLANDSPYGSGDFIDSDDEATKSDVDVEGTDGEAAAFRPGIVHRLDKGTTGVLVVAKTRASLATLSASFKERTVKKTYLAVTVGNPGTSVKIDKPIGRHPTHRQRMRVVPDPHRQSSGGYAPKDRMIATAVSGRRALSYVDMMAFDGKLSLVQVRIETGRTHQIRVHLQDRHTPILGDEVYGLADWNKRLLKQHSISRPLLHAYTLEVNHPVTGERMSFRAPMAEDMNRISKNIWPQSEEERPDLFD